MTPDETVYSTLCTSGLKGTYNAWPIGDVPPLPWFVYRHKKDKSFFADNSNYAYIDRYTVDLYQYELDDAVSDAFEDAIALLGPFACLSEIWNAGENCWITSYHFTFHPNNE